MGKLHLPRPCGKHIELTADEHAALDAIQHGAHQINWQMDCEYELGHPSPHTALGQSVDNEDNEQMAAWWMRWSPTERDAAYVPYDQRCPTEGNHPHDAPDEEPWQCEFPASHPGAHTWQMEGFVEEEDHGLQPLHSPGSAPK